MTICLQLALGLCVLFGLGATAAGDPLGEAKVTAQLTTGVVKLGGEFACVVQVEGVRQASLDEVPEIPGLRLIRRSVPSTQQSRYYASNGKASFSISHTWVLTFRPQEKGDFVIPALKLKVDGKAAFTRELTVSVVEDMTGQELGYFAFDGVPERIFEGQPFTIRMNFGWDAQYDSTVNVANLILPWWSELPGTLEVESDVAGLKSRLVEVQVNSRIRVRAVDLGEEVVRGKTFRILQLSRSYVATRSGTLDFPQSWLEFGHIKRRAFSEDRETFHVGVAAFSLLVSPLPEEGRPPEFSGGVGSFLVQADVNRRDVDLGESIKLTVDWTGEANLEFFELPNPARLPSFDGFRVYGTTNERFYGDRRRVVYDLAPKNSDVGEIPALPLVVFDPELGTYRTVSSRPIPIRVRAIDGLSGLTEEGEDGSPALAARDVQDPSDDSSDVQGVGTGVLFGTWFGIPALWLLARTNVRRRGDPGAPPARRRRKARRQLSRSLGRAQSASDQAQALHTFLGARSAEDPSAWEGRDIPGWLAEENRAFKNATMEEFMNVGEELNQSRWAGADTKLESQRLLLLADLLMKEGL